MILYRRPFQITTIGDIGLHCLSNNSKTCLKQSLKIDKTKVLMENDSILKVEVLQNDPLGAFCNTFDLHLAIIVVENQCFCSF